jgi:hypothetical protein
VSITTGPGVTLGTSVTKGTSVVFGNGVAGGVGTPLATVASINPVSGSSAGGTAVTITGTGFSAGTGATIGGAPVTSFVVVNDTTITGVAPAGTLGTRDIVVLSPGGNGTLVNGYRYLDPDSTALFARMTVQPTEPRKVLYSDFIVAMKAGGVWAKRDTVYLLAAHDAQAARLNVRQNAFNCAEVLAPTFTTDRGYTSAGNGSFLDTTYAPATSGGLWVLNSASLAAYMNTNVDDTTGPIVSFSGSGSLAFVNPRSAGGAFAGLNDGGFTVIASGVTTSVGYSAATRQVSTEIRTRLGGVNRTQAAAASVALATGTISIGGRAGESTPGRIAYAASGSGLSDAEMAAEETAVLTYLTAIGAQ